MSMILSPSDAAVSIGAKCGGSTPDADNPMLIEILKGITARICAAMNVDSLDRDTYMDRFYLPDDFVRGVSRPRIRLSNGYVVSDSFTLFDEDGETAAQAREGEALAISEFGVDKKYGIAELSIPMDRGYYTLEYNAGFRSNEGVYEDVPDWMRSLVNGLLVLWYRTTVLQVKAPKDTSFSAVMIVLQRELHTRIYEQYQRPRVGCIFADAR